MITAQQARDLMKSSKQQHSEDFETSPDGIAAAEFLDGEIRAAIALNANTSRLQMPVSALHDLYLSMHPNATPGELVLFAENSAALLVQKGYVTFMHSDGRMQVGWDGA